MYLCRYLIWIRITYNILIILQHFLGSEYSEIKGTHRENTLSNKTEVLTKSRNRNIWVVCKSNQIKVLRLKLNFQKNEAVKGKSKFFVIGPFCTPHSICLNIGLLRGQICTEILLHFHLKYSELENEQHSKFFKKVVVFQKICCTVFSCVKAKTKSPEAVIHFLSIRWINLLNSKMVGVGEWGVGSGSGVSIWSLLLVFPKSYVSKRGWGSAFLWLLRLP